MNIKLRKTAVELLLAWQFADLKRSLEPGVFLTVFYYVPHKFCPADFLGAEHDFRTAFSHLLQDYYHRVLVDLVKERMGVSFAHELGVAFLLKKEHLSGQFSHVFHRLWHFVGLEETQVPHPLHLLKQRQRGSSFSRMHRIGTPLNRSFYVLIDGAKNDLVRLEPLLSQRNLQTEHREASLEARLVLDRQRFTKIERF